MRTVIDVEEQLEAFLSEKLPTEDAEKALGLFLEGVIAGYRGGQMGRSLFEIEVHEKAGYPEE